MTEATPTICGFVHSDTSLCLMNSLARGKYCTTHEGLECAGCGKRATSACPHTNDHGNTFCERPLCDKCEHRVAEGHGPKVTVRDAAYEELTAAFRLSLEDAAEKGLCVLSEGKENQLATKVLNDVSMHVTMKILSGIAQAPQ